MVVPRRLSGVEEQPEIDQPLIGLSVTSAVSPLEMCRRMRGCVFLQMHGGAGEQADGVGFARTDVDVAGGSGVAQRDFRFGFPDEPGDLLRALSKEHPSAVRVICRFPRTKELFAEAFLQLPELARKRRL